MSDSFNSPLCITKSNVFCQYCPVIRGQGCPRIYCHLKLAQSSHPSNASWCPASVEGCLRVYPQSLPPVALLLACYPMLSLHTKPSLNISLRIVLGLLLVGHRYSSLCCLIVIVGCVVSCRCYISAFNDFKWALLVSEVLRVFVIFIELGLGFLFERTR